MNGHTSNFTYTNNTGVRSHVILITFMKAHISRRRRPKQLLTRPKRKANTSPSILTSHSNRIGLTSPSPTQLISNRRRPLLIRRTMVKRIILNMIHRSLSTIRCDYNIMAPTIKNVNQYKNRISRGRHRHNRTNYIRILNRNLRELPTHPLRA